MITLKIDVTKITKERLFKGQKGTYLNCVLIPTPNSKYGDYMIKENVSKEERDKGVDGAILGNAKEYKPNNNLPEGDIKSNNTPMEMPDTDLPF